MVEGWGVLAFPKGISQPRPQGKKVPSRACAPSLAGLRAAKAAVPPPARAQGADLPASG